VACTASSTATWNAWRAYGRVLDHHVDRTWIYLLVMVAALASWGLLKLLPSELAPAEDRGSFQIMIDGPEGAGYDYTVQQVQQVEALLAPHVGPDKPIVRANPRVPGGRCQRGNAHRPRQHLPAAVAPAQRGHAGRGQRTAEGTGHHPRRARAYAGGGGLVRSGGQPFQIVLGGRNTPRSRSGATASCCAWPTTPAWSARTRTTRKPGRRCG
jgi:multidrug efflux pump